MIREDKRLNLHERVWEYQLSLDKPMTNYQMAKEIGIAPYTFGRFMDGKPATNTTLIKIEKFLERVEDKGLGALAEEVMKTEKKEDYVDIKEVKK